MKSPHAIHPGDITMILINSITSLTFFIFKDAYAIYDITATQFRIVDEGLTIVGDVWLSQCNSAACQTVDLSQNSFTSTGLPDLELRNAPNDEFENRVKYLNLSHNVISNVSLEVFSPGAQADTSWTLISLDLSYNAITDLSTFPSTLTRGSLERIYLQNNQISQLGNLHVFYEATTNGFLGLNLEFNQLTEMPTLGFGMNPTVTEVPSNAIINVKNNIISTVDLSSYPHWGFMYLITVNLENNLLTQWTFEMIDQNWDTEEYILNNNKIAHIAAWSPSDGASYYNLKSLYINNNEVVTIDSHAFDNFNNLEILEMKYNKITNFPFDSIFDGSTLPRFCSAEFGEQ